MKRYKKDCEKLPSEERLDLARQKLKSIVPLMLGLISLNENNAILVYSERLAGQIPRSLAANAFTRFQRAMHEMEILKLTALWDRPESEKICIPAVTSLIDNQDVMEIIFGEIENWYDQPARFLSPSEDVQSRKTEEITIAFDNKRLGQQDAMKAKKELSDVIELVEELYESNKLISIKNIRDKYIAHALTETRQERKGIVRSMKCGDEIELLQDSIDLVQKLSLWLNGSNIDMNREFRRAEKEQAEELWHNCHFDIPS